ncbi:anaerobic ribonucleoside-triphosphate reductase [Paludicola sp. MB14-C6]|uniref:anaerobic ribonucleoside-triphosphate reductase n=1 Tax=Paludihabitans sp. MB14-C6 TaxID=3070656 RepID=UPI0027DDCF2C|nr:anaerobic ribonucleoside-triphosphate reductase [Paludicola sp. MB14-C6]WMJ24009.1 anaerobic ribonucleoside-triphosphate reductase [Paludicola sp. MB14-C6]
MTQTINIIGGTLEQNEVNAYIEYVKLNNPNEDIETLNIELDGEFVNLTYTLKPIPFERIRRVTGYLVGTLDRFNDGKRAEERDRVKHM